MCQANTQNRHAVTVFLCFLAAGEVDIQTWKLPEDPSANERLTELWYIHTVEGDYGCQKQRNPTQPCKC